MPSEVLLHHLNDILGTSHKLTTDGMRSLLKEIRATSHDFGEAYGKVRQWWTIPHLDGVHGLVYYTSLYRREATREARRRHAVESSSLSSSYMPPRRIWDLHSNRVVPLGVILGDDYGDTFDVLPDQLWTISHSWVADAERKMVWTTINNKRWPVPIPRATSLEHIRVELLNMGAEYVWLDVLCLRQQGREEDEDRRIEEWKIDVPTIGYIYRGNPRSRPCVTYFNGLGLPLTTGLSALSSDRHWFNRVWTLQESLTTWLPGGLTGEALPAGTEFFSRLEGLARLVAVEDQNDHLVSELIRRHCAKELDRIAGLTYCFRCPTLTLYDETASVEQAWRSLLKHATSSVWRHSIFLRYAADTPFALFPSWKTYSVGDPILSPMTGCSSSELDISHVYACNMEQLHHRGYHFLSETCKISSLSPRTADDGLSPATLRLHFPSKSRSVVVTPVDIHGALLSTAFYRIVRICSIPYQFWVIVEDVSEPLPHSFDQQRKLPTVSARPVIKWAVLQISEHDEDRLSAFVTDDQEVVYLSEAESLKKTKHGRKYLQMFQHMKETGRTYMSRFA
ncbi:hypothetical protein PsYK624_053300 [Phanerochaete sordida]|uniref:Heterokaryon incompatibility domain-containing protein n=1 Tax=Phanerochaete sordida TaxID=48140 RepID=A0A9P3G7G6_9APHY|nr:hypothetical protein PsYK624_053300 [Phanerochaete sordida]